MDDSGPKPGPSVMGHTASILASSLAQYAAVFIASALLSRVLGPTGRGIFYLPVLGATTILAFCKLGVDQANIYLAGSRGVPLDRLSAQNGLVGMVMGGAGVLATLALPWILPDLFRDTPIRYLLAAGMTIPLGIHMQLSGGLLSLAGQPRWPYRAGTLGALAQILILLVLLSRGGVSPGQALGIVLAATAISWTVTTWALRRLTSVRPAADGALLAQTIRNALILHAGSMLLFLHLRLDMFMVKAWIGVEALGLYSISVVLGETLMLATESIALAILPGQVADTVEGASARALRAARAAVLVGGALAAGWAVFGAPLIRIVFGADYSGSYLPLLVLLPGMVTLGVQRVCTAAALRSGRSSMILAISGASLACNALLNVLWIPRYGLVGASAASSVSYVLSTSLFYFWTVKTSGIRLRDALLFDRTDRLAVAEFIRSHTQRTSSLTRSAAGEAHIPPPRK